MKVRKFIGIVALFATLGLGIAGHNEGSSVSAEGNASGGGPSLIGYLPDLKYPVTIKGVKKYVKINFQDGYGGNVGGESDDFLNVSMPYIKGYTPSSHGRVTIKWKKDWPGTLTTMKKYLKWNTFSPVSYNKLKIISSKTIKKAPVRIASKAYNVYDYPRILKSNSKFMHYGKSNHSTTFYITKTIKLNNGSSYSWLVNGSGKAYGYINTAATGNYVKPKTDKVDKKHTPVRIMDDNWYYNVYSYPRALHITSKFMHYSSSNNNTKTFFISKNVTTASNVKYSKLTYADGKLYGYINAKALKNYTTVKNVKTVSSKTKYRVSSAKHNIYSAPSDTAYGVKTTHYGKNYLKTNFYVTKTETRVQDGAKFSYVKTSKNNLGWIYSGYLKAQK